MPIYEYVCNACGHEFEEWQKISDAPVSKCPGCGKRKVERMVSLSAFHLKGSGWYVTDYAAKKPGTQAGERKEKPETKGESKSESKSESKPATKSESKPATKSD